MPLTLGDQFATIDRLKFSKAQTNHYTSHSPGNLHLNHHNKMARDLFHDVVKTALIKDGWTITNDPLFLKVGGVDFFIDLGAEKLLAAERDNHKIAIEIKSFINTSGLSDFHLAIGQFINYRVALEVFEPQRELFLAIPDTAYETFFQKAFPQMVIEKYQLKFLVYDVNSEVILEWKL